MERGVIRYDTDGKPICELCGKSFNRVAAHVRQVHNITARDYKKKFGLDVLKGICSKASKERSRAAALANYDNVIKKNLIEGGSKSRYKVGSKGRTKDMVSAQTRQMLQKHFASISSIDERKQQGKKLGESGLGNKARWG
jgi:hypothetical protein